ncbi:phage tail protein I [Salmonella enterica]|nr:phage tail protein I [Salmonella enterica subsp. diarizonae]ELB6470211.1 phage tail protein I [Salmonella enterica]
MSKSLLPTGSTPLEKAAAEAAGQISKLNVPLRLLWDPWRCPLPLLPYLAWAFSVDQWDDNWPEQTRRQIVATSFDIHRKKGTIGAIRRVVTPLGYLRNIQEWWEFSGEPGTFSIDVGVLDSGISEEIQQELERLINDARPLSRHLVKLNIIQDIPGNIFSGTVAYDGDIVTIYPGVSS